MRTEPFDNLLIQAFASRREQNQMSWVFVLGANGFDTLHDRFDLDDHSGATAERPVIDRLMFSSRPISEVVQCNVDQPILDRFVEQALA